MRVDSLYSAVHATVVCAQRQPIDVHLQRIVLKYFMIKENKTYFSYFPLRLWIGLNAITTVGGHIKNQDAHSQQTSSVCSHLSSFMSLSSPSMHCRIWPLHKLLCEILWNFALGGRRLHCCYSGSPTWKVNHCISVVSQSSDTNGSFSSQYGGPRAPSALSMFLKIVNCPHLAAESLTVGDGSGDGDGGGGGGGKAHQMEGSTWRRDEWRLGVAPTVSPSSQSSFPSSSSQTN